MYEYYSISIYMMTYVNILATHFSASKSLLHNLVIIIKKLVYRYM